nr:biliverdin-producing heme oxygenase [Cellulomonas sp. JH27-2]
MSVALREGTRAEHETAERSGFVEQLMGGRLDRSAYAALAVQQHAFYTALEQAGARLKAAGLDSALVFDELTRVPAIEADLQFLLGPDWREQLVVLPATRAYVARLEACQDDVALYAAHAYTRYLGDLSGGQIIKRMMQRHYGFEQDGISFYDFPQIHKLKPFKDVYRERLDALAFDDEQRARVVEEARTAFVLNQAVFRELGDLHRATSDAGRTVG